MKKARCNNCEYLNWNFLTDEREQNSTPFCGLHGRAHVDPNGQQMNLDSHGGCDYTPKHKPQQLTLF